MSDLRDARLRRALESAPDAHMQPDARTRAAILSAARGAGSAAAGPLPWWRGLWAATGQRGPWNAAFASVLVAGLVTLLWYDREVPDARPDTATVASARPSAPTEASARPSAPLPAPAAEGAPQARPAPAPADAPAPVRRESKAQAQPPRTAAAPSPSPIARAPEADSAGSNRAADAVMAEQAARQSQARERQDLAKAAPPPALADASPSFSAAAPAAPPAAVAQAAPPAAAPMARSAPAPGAPVAPAAPASRAPDPEVGLSAGPPAAARPREEAAPVRLVLQGREVDVPAGRARRLVELAQAAARSAQGSEPLAAPVTLRLELRQGATAGVLEVAGPQVRWNGLTGRPEAALLQALEEEAARWLAR